ncbi:MAG: nuclear transport factor 2 family protein [Pseudomonadota bacterium]
MRIVLALLLIFSPAFVTGAYAEQASDEETLRHFKTVLWPQAYRTQDAELLGRLLHDSFQMIDGDGNRSTKEGEIDFVRNNEWDPGTFEYRIERLDIYDNGLAIVDGAGIAENYTYKSSNVLIKEDGVWRAVASHVSGYKRTDGE